MAAASAFAAYPRILCLPSPHLNPSPHFSSGLGIGDSLQILARGKTIKAKETVRARAFWNQHEEKPSSVEMEPISTPEQLDHLLAQDQNPIIIDWMATWCRKCIYLKPKLEKLAAEFYPKIKFYYVNVNAVPQALVKRGGVSKMPTIQLWKNGEMKAEVIGGHKGWLVVDEVREMIERN